MSGQKIGPDYLKEKLEFALEISNFGFWEFYVEANDTIHTLQHDHIFGYSTPIEKWSYEIFIQHVYPKDKDRVDIAFKEFIAKETEYKNEFRIVRADRKVRWVYVNAKKIIDKKGKVVRVIGLTKDITKERKQEKRRDRVQHTFNRFAKSVNFVLFKASIAFNKIIYLNREIERILGVSLEYLAENPSAFIDFVVLEDKKKVKEFHSKNRESQNSNKSIEYRVVRVNGEVRNVYESLFYEKNEDGKIIGFLGTISDLTDVYLEKKLNNIRMEAENIIMEDTDVEKSCESILEMLCTQLMFDFGEILLLDSKKTSLYRMAYSYPKSPLKLSSQEEVFFPENNDLSIESISRMLKSETPFFFHNISEDFTRIVDRDSYLNFFNIYGTHLKSNNNIIGFMLFYTKAKIRPDEKISKVVDYVAIQLGDKIQKNYMQQQMDVNAKYDSLTGLPNKYLFLQTIKELINTSVEPLPFSVVKLQIDKFDEISDFLSSNEVELLLKQFVDRLANSPPPHLKHLSRLEFIKFGLIFEGFSENSVVENIAEKLLMSIKEPFFIGKQRIFLTVSIGICFYPQDGQDEVILLKNTATSLSKAILQGGDCFVSWTSLLSENAVKRLNLKMSLKQALVNKEFELYYQPKINFKTGKAVGAEALIRWNNPKQGVRLPDTFLAFAEESDLIVQIGEWVLRDVCRTIINNSLGVPIALNLSVKQFKKKNQFLKILSKVIDEYKIDCNKLELEITESILMNGTENINILKDIQKMGIKISFDDFGIGYSSFNYLKYFMPNRIKLDKSFIDGIPTIPSSVAIVKAVITLCKSLDIKTTAEGPETVDQLKFLIEEGCDEVQAFYFAHPLPISEASKIIEKDFKDLIPQGK